MPPNHNKTSVCKKGDVERMEIRGYFLKKCINISTSLKFPHPLLTKH